MPRVPLLLLVLLTLTLPAAAQQESSTLLHYARPARQWVEALPVGNGRLGAMVFGGAAEERIARAM